MEHDEDILMQATKFGTTRGLERDGGDCRDRNGAEAVVEAVIQQAYDESMPRKDSSALSTGGRGSSLLSKNSVSSWAESSSVTE